MIVNLSWIGLSPVTRFMKYKWLNKLRVSIGYPTMIIVTVVGVQCSLLVYSMSLQSIMWGIVYWFTVSPLKLGLTDQGLSTSIGDIRESILGTIRTGKVWHDRTVESPCSNGIKRSIIVTVQLDVKGRTGCLGITRRFTIVHIPLPSPATRFYTNPFSFRFALFVQWHVTLTESSSFWEERGLQNWSLEESK